MNWNRLRAATASACLLFAIASAPAAAGGQTAATAVGPYVPGELIVGLAHGGSTVAQLPEGTSVPEGISELEGDPGVEFAVPNYTATASAISPLDGGSTGVPGGWRADQWSFLGRPGGIRVQRAWNRLERVGAPGGAGTVVAVVDSGIAYGAEPGFSLSPDFTTTKFVPGIDLVDDDSSPLDFNGHGTHVAGTIAEQLTLGQPATGPDYLTGIAYGTTLMPVRVLDPDGVGDTDDVANGILWAARNGADVINLSLNLGPEVSSCVQVPTVCDAVRKATQLGALVVGSAGNAVSGQGEKRTLFPAAAPRAFAVASTTEHGCLAAYSFYGKRTDLLAPGGGTPRTAAARPACSGDALPILQLTYECFPAACDGARQKFAIRPDVGTSMSAAHTSAVAALVIASGVAGPDPTPERLARRLRCTAHSGSPARFYGAGMLDATRAVDRGRRCDRVKR